MAPYERGAARHGALVDVFDPSVLRRPGVLVPTVRTPESLFGEVAVLEGSGIDSRTGWHTRT